MDIKEFAEKYNELKEKAIGIMRIHGIKTEWFDSIDIAYCFLIKKKLMFHVHYERQWSGCDSDWECLVFDLEEMDNDLSYFQSKYDKETEAFRKEQEERRKREENEQQERERLNEEARKELQEARDLIGYQRVIERMNKINKDEKQE